MITTGTCKHVAHLVPSADKINATYLRFKAERDKLANDGKYHKLLTGLETKYKYTKETTIQLKNNFLNCFDKLEQIVCHVHPTLDLAIMEFKGFEKILYNGYASFIKDSSSRTEFPVRSAAFWLHRCVREEA